MNRMLLGTGLMGLVCLVGTVGCTGGKAAKKPVAQSVPVSAPVQAAPAPVGPSDFLKACLARIESGSSEGARMVAEQSCQENEALHQTVAGTAIMKSGNRASSGTQGDSLEACMARIPQDATAGQRMLAEDSCQRDQSLHH